MNDEQQRPVLPDVADANSLLLDRQLFDCEGRPVGKIDDLELSDPVPGRTPVVTAILCGPTGLGPRIGGRLGTWWLSIGRRLRGGDPYPVRIPFSDVQVLTRAEVRLSRPAEELGTQRLEDWVGERVARIPGSHT
jgi:hypothetical protein